MKLSDDMKARLSALFFILFVEASAYFIMPYAPRDELYYAAAGSFNFLTLALLTAIKNNRLQADLMRLTFLQLIIQFMGWVLYSLYMPAHLYNWGIHAIVAATFVRIFWLGRNDGDPAMHSDRRIFHRAFLWRIGDTRGVHK